MTPTSSWKRPQTLNITELYRKFVAYYALSTAKIHGGQRPFHRQHQQQDQDTTDRPNAPRCTELPQCNDTSRFSQRRPNGGAAYRCYEPIKALDLPADVITTHSVCGGLDADDVISDDTSKARHQRKRHLPHLNGNAKFLSRGKYSNTYSDPVLNAPACFLQRIGELTTLEAQTVRREKTTKSKKKQFLE